jgi:hypothetical protein
MTSVLVRLRDQLSNFARSVFVDARQNTQARHLVFPLFAHVAKQYSNLRLGGREIWKTFESR